MNTYFRITAYHPAENISAILDSFGKFDKLWKFSSFLITKGFKIIEVSADDKFLDGDLPRIQADSEHIILRACANGHPQALSYEINGKTYRAVQVRNKIYIPDKAEATK